MAIDVSNPYFRTKVLTASPEQLRMMLLEGCLRFSRDGRDGLSEKNFEKVFEGFTNAKNILMELINALRPEHSPELCRNLEALYLYMFRTLTEASFEKNIAKADEVIELLEYECETWQLLMQKLGSGSGDESTASHSPSGATATRSDAGPRPTLSLQG